MISKFYSSPTPKTGLPSLTQTAMDGLTGMNIINGLLSSQTSKMPLKTARYLKSKFIKGHSVNWHKEKDILLNGMLEDILLKCTQDQSKNEPFPSNFIQLTMI